MEKKQVRCPKCGTTQPLQRYCVKCKLDFQAYAAYLRKKKAAQADQSASNAGQPVSSDKPPQPKPRPSAPTGGSPLGREGSGVQAKSIVCPKCRMRQPLRPKCAKCGFDIKTYVLQKQQGGTPDINIEKPIAPAAPPKSEWGESKPLRPDQFEEGENPFDSSSRYWAPPASESSAAEGADGLEPDPGAPTGEGLREIGKLFSDAWALYVKRLGTLMGVYISAIALAVMPMVLAIALGAVVMPISPEFGIFIAIGFGTMGALLFVYLGSWGYSAMYFAVTDRTLGFKAAWSYGRTRIWSMFSMLLLLGCLLQGTILLFIIPGIIFAVYSSLTKFVLIDEGATGMNAVLRSRQYIKGLGWPVFGRLCLIWLLAAAVGAIPFIGPILSLFATPFAMVYLYLIYRDLQAAKQSLPGYVPTGGEKAKWIIAATMGFILALSLIAAGGFYVYKKYGGDIKQFMQMFEQGQMQDFERMMEEDYSGGRDGGGFGDQGTFGGRIDTDVIRPYEYERIMGRWSGKDSRGNDFTFEFMDGYYATISSSSLGENIGAELFVDFDLGYDPSIDAVRVPPGASMLDFRIASSTNASDMGKVSAGVYSLAFDREMRLCTGRPGSGVRPTEYEPSQDVICFQLTKQASAAPPTRAPALDAPSGRLARTQKDVYAPGESITIEFSGMPGNKQDWITLVQQSASTNTYGQWFYTSGSKSGTFTFSGMKEGEYEIRTYFDWPSGGYTVQDRHYFRVGPAGGGASGSGASGSGAPGASVMPSVTLNKDTFGPGDPINVTFTAPSTYRPNAWIGIIPSHVSHGSESENDSYDISYQYLQGQTSGILVFHAPSAPGRYDMRMHDTDDSGREVAYASFTVTGGGASSGGLSGDRSGGGSPRGGSTEESVTAWIFIYCWNYSGEVWLNGKSIQVLEGEQNVQYSYNTSSTFKRGSNVVDVTYKKVPAQQNYSIEITFTDSASDRKYGPFVIDQGEGSRRFTFNYP